MVPRPTAHAGPSPVRAAGTARVSRLCCSGARRPWRSRSAGRRPHRHPRPAEPHARLRGPRLSGWAARFSRGPTTPRPPPGTRRASATCARPSCRSSASTTASPPCDNLDNDSLKGSSVDFAAFTWPVGAGEVRGAVQLSYQRAISFDGTRRSSSTGPSATTMATAPSSCASTTAVSDGGFDVVALGTGLRLSRHVRAGFTVNRWLNGYEQSLERNLLQPADRPASAASSTSTSARAAGASTSG